MFRDENGDNFWVGVGNVLPIKCETENSRRTLPINAGFEDGEREPPVKKCDL